MRYPITRLNVKFDIRISQGYTTILIRITRIPFSSQGNYLILAIFYSPLLDIILESTGIATCIDEKTLLGFLLSVLIGHLHKSDDALNLSALLSSSF